MWRGELSEVVPLTIVLSHPAGQAQWVPRGSEGGKGGEEEEVVFVGWENKPRKLGILYSLNRLSALYHAHLTSSKIMISEWQLEWCTISVQ